MDDSSDRLGRLSRLVGPRRDARRLSHRACLVRALARAADAGRGGPRIGDAVALPALVPPVRSRGGSHGGRGGGALVHGDGGARRPARRLRPLRDVPAARGLRAAWDLPAARRRARRHSRGADGSDGGADRDGRRGSRPSPLCGTRSGPGAGDGRHALPGGRGPAWVRSGLLRQAGAARLHQRGRADRDRVPAGQALRDKRRGGRLLPNRLGGPVGAGRRERADRSSERGPAGGGDRGSALLSRPAPVPSCARVGARDCRACRPGGSRDRGRRRGRGRPALLRAASGSEQTTSSISCFPRRHSRSSPSPT